MSKTGNRKTVAGLMMFVACAACAASPRHMDAEIRSDVGNVYKYLIRAWTATLGSGLTPPRLVYYDRPRKTGCGDIKLGNAFFCQEDNALYIDTSFIAEVDEAAAEKLKSVGDYAGLAVVAHEFGHAVEHSVSPLPGSEGGADCFAGVAFGYALADKRFPDYAFDEAMFFMEYASDDTILGFNPKNRDQVLFTEFFFGPLDHGIVAQRQAAFLRGFYGGPSFCTATLKKPAPQAGKSILASQPLAFLKVPPSASPDCQISSGSGGMRVRSSGGPCVINLLPSNTLLPDHLRIELTVTFQPNTSHPGGTAGIYYGDSRSTSHLVRFGYAPTGPTDAAVVNLDGAPQVEEPDLKGFWFIGRLPSPTAGAQHLTVDVHHEGKNLYFIEYLNGVAVAHNGLWQHGTKNFRLNVAEFHYDSDQAGLWVRGAGSEAVFSDFRVSAIYR
jgi:predicted metalloprotease